MAMSGFASWLLYLFLFDADSFDAKTGGFLNAVLGAVLVGAAWLTIRVAGVGGG
jgi:hypothetical protein